MASMEKTTGHGLGVIGEENVEPLAVLGALAVLIGIIGVVVLIKGKKKRRQ
jgi:LPXTG-motif cell wall-anchored protein